MIRSALVVGCGYVGLSVARLLFKSGWEVLGLTGSDASSVALRNESFPVRTADITLPSTAGDLADQRFGVAIHCASSGRGGVPRYEEIFYQGISHLAKLNSHLIMASSTSVYAQTDGEWVDETSKADPIRETSQILRRAEEIVLKQGGTVARLAGIYGPGRYAPLRRLKAGEAVIEENGSRIMNMIHRDDAASALAFLADHQPGGIFNVVDDYPVTQFEWYSWACRHFHLPFPPTGPKNELLKRGWTHKRVSNAKIKQLGWEPSRPSFRDHPPD